MRHERPAGGMPDDPFSIKQALLRLLCGGGQPLWTMSELDRALARSEEARKGELPYGILVEDAVSDLYAAGLVHRFGQFVFASRAALESERLAN